jgi:uncharacterized protein (TIGR02996 family)
VSHASDGAALLRAIIDNPEEDTPRLMFADWLDEQGDEASAARAEFIRFQIAEEAKAKRKHINSVGVHRFPTRREQELVRRYGGFEPCGWCAGLPQVERVRYQNSHDVERFSRGFPWRVSAPDVDTFLKIAPALFEVAPITYLHLANLKINTARALAASPFLGRIQQWQDVYARRTDKMLAEVAKSDHLGNLREIDMTGTEITATGVMALVSAPSLRCLKRLTFASCAVGDAGVMAIAGSRACATLEHLSLTYRPLSAAAARALAGSPLRQSMRSLLLSDTRLDDAAALALASVEWPRLQYLIVNNNAITDRGAEAFLDSVFWRSSECELWFSSNELSAGMGERLKEAFGPRARF